MTGDVGDFEAAVVGLRVGGKYTVEKVIGRGGMGCVALGKHDELGQKVAIKFMLDGAANNESLTSRFMREAQLAAKLQSEHVVRVFDVGKLEGGLPYMVMEYLEGISLADELEKKTRIAPTVAIDYVLQALEAIAEAHALGVVHRDLKPDNLFLARKVGSSKTVKVLDFGISKVAGGGNEDHSLTQTTAVLGSPLYMSPEQIRTSKSVDARSDIWSLGVVLYLLIEGSPPFIGESIGELFGKIQYVDPPPMHYAPPGFEAIVRKCLARNPDDRYPSVRQLADDLAPFAAATSEKSLQVIHQVLSPPTLGSSSPDVVAVARAYSTRPPPIAVAVSAIADSNPMSQLEVGKTLDISTFGGEVPSVKKRSSRSAFVAAAVGGAALLAVVSFGVSRGGSSSAPSGAAANAVARDTAAPPAKPTSEAVPQATVVTPPPAALPSAAPATSASAAAVIVTTPSRPATKEVPRPAAPVLNAPAPRPAAPAPKPVTHPVEPDRGF